jgi:hypothetical protein
MPVITVTPSPARWKVTVAHPPDDRADPEMILELQALVGELDLGAYGALFASAARVAVA